MMPPSSSNLRVFTCLLYDVAAPVHASRRAPVAGMRGQAGRVCEDFRQAALVRDEGTREGRSQRHHNELLPHCKFPLIDIFPDISN